MQSSGGEFQESLIRKQPSCRFPTILPVSLHNSRTILSKVEPVVGFEPTTDGLQNRCSTTELNWHPSAKGYTTKEIARKRFHCACGRSTSVTFMRRHASHLLLHLLFQALHHAQVFLEGRQG